MKPKSMVIYVTFRCRKCTTATRRQWRSTKTHVTVHCKKCQESRTVTVNDAINSGNYGRSVMRRLLLCM